MKFGTVVSEKKPFESVDGRRTDDRGCLSYELPRSLRLRGGENVSRIEQPVSLYMTN